MRRAVLALALALASLAGLAAPAAVGDSSVKIANFSFSPGTVSIHRGERVTWSWSGSDKNHTVTSDPGQAESFESHPGVATPLVMDGPPGETFSHTFTHTGTFSYFCRVHTFMTGKVSVVAPGAPLADTKAPTTKLKIRRVSPRSAARSGRLKLKVTVDEAATETLVAKLGRRTIARKKVKFRSAGTKTVRLKLNRKGRRALRRRRRARVSVRATAVDAAGNKKSKRASLTLGAKKKSSSPTPPSSPTY
jgi:plastocyanin